MQQVWEYVVLVGNRWKGLYAGPIAAAITVLILFFGTKWGIPMEWRTGLNWLSISVAIALIPVAQYMVWADQVALKRAVQANNVLPDIKGTATGFRGDPNFPFGEHKRDVGWAAEWHALFSITFSNHRNVVTNIQRIEVDGSKLVPPLSFEELTYLPTIAEYAISKNLLVQARVWAFGCRQEDIQKLIDLSELSVTVIDGLGNRHAIQVEPQATLGFPWFRVSRS